jgi:hypothetical protein
MRWPMPEYFYEGAEVSERFFDWGIASDGNAPFVSPEGCIDRPHEALARWDADAGMS